ncbi:MAG: acyl-CoA/acyl-ACP dehydrogenase [Alphaproteobacteria bacterium]|nr:acyl-CoA/acyl-ACP dehydrogenase [Alphaproteobacteria bacterium]
MSVREEALASLEPHVAGVIAANAARVDADAAYPHHAFEALRQAGLMGLVTAREHGGLSGSFGDAAAVVERIARECGSSAMVVCMHYAGAAVLAAFGSAEVNRAVGEGRHVSTLAFSEAGSRSHFWAPLSTARVDGDEVVLDAKKSWITSAHHATAFIWSSQAVGGEGSTIWLVPNGSKGLHVPEPYRGLGLRGNDSTPMTAVGVRAPASNRLGEDGGGFDAMMGVVLPIFQLMNAACSVGLMEGALRGATAHVSGTRYAHLGSSLADLPTVRAYLAKARNQADAARTLWLDAIEAVEGGRPDAMLRVLQVKALAGDTALDVVSTCMRVCGGAAYRKELGVERCFRDAQAASVMAPTSDVLYDFIGKALCGMDLF